MADSAASDTVTFEHVTVLRKDSLTIICRIQGRSVIVGHMMVEPGSTVLNGHAVDGTLVLLRWRAEELGLLDGSQPI